MAINGEVLAILIAAGSLVLILCVAAGMFVWCRYRKRLHKIRAIIPKSPRLAIKSPARSAPKSPNPATKSPHKTLQSKASSSSKWPNLLDCSSSVEHPHASMDAHAVPKQTPFCRPPQNSFPHTSLQPPGLPPMSPSPTKINRAHLPHPSLQSPGPYRVRLPSLSPSPTKMNRVQYFTSGAPLESPLVVSSPAPGQTFGKRRWPKPCSEPEAAGSHSNAHLSMPMGLDSC